MERCYPNAAITEVITNKANVTLSRLVPHQEGVLGMIQVGQHVSQSRNLILFSQSNLGISNWRYCERLITLITRTRHAYLGAQYREDACVSNNGQRQRSYTYSSHPLAATRYV